MKPKNIKFGSCSSAIDDYANLNTMVAKFVEQTYGSQPGNPRKAAEIIIDIVKQEGVAKGRAAPERLPLESDVLSKIRNKYSTYLHICDEWASVITSTDFDDAQETQMQARVLD
ncbi:hypothetical protein BJ878DRAFT_529269 [Calycina marina]|uniref:Uncharacterized protein n=1 Tax=Calycina marina TaxID=1763456 RepID=A0A9P8CAX2_9HELO|nr:hypothetical protein BJ878DRAFT_529269 [Calycina marina]